MSTLRVSAVNNAAASVGGLAIDSSGNVTGGLPSPNRNLLYNGAMQVSQRGTSTTSITGNGFYTADRWQTRLTGLGTWTQSIENDAPTGSGFRKSLKMLCTTADASPAAGDQLLIRQILEGQDIQRVRKGTSSAQKLTLSFWVKSNVTGTYICSIYDNDNNRIVSAAYTISASATWENKTITFPADTTGAFDNDNAASLYFDFGLGAGSTYTSGTLQTTWDTFANQNWSPGQTNVAAATNNYWQVTGVQLETGDVATDFEFKSYGQELRECQRYYYRIDAGATQRLFGAGQVYNTTNAIVGIPYKVPMRTRPTALEQSGTAGHYQVFKSDSTAEVCNLVPIFDTHTTLDQAAVIARVAGSITAGNATLMTAANAAAYLAWSAEL